MLAKATLNPYLGEYFLRKICGRHRYSRGYALERGYAQYRNPLSTFLRNFTVVRWESCQFVADLLETCYGEPGIRQTVTDLLRGNWCNGFWPLCPKCIGHISPRQLPRVDGEVSNLLWNPLPTC